jgi:hypothetical protein
MISFGIVVLTLLNAALAAMFGWYASLNFPKQSHTRVPEVTASFFRLNDYVKAQSLDSYRKAFCLLIALAVFCPLEVLAFSPLITEASNAYLLDKLIQLAGNAHAATIKNINAALPHSVLPLVTGVAGLCVFFPQVTFCLSKCRDVMHRMVDFKGNAQRLVNETLVAIDKPQEEIEQKLEAEFERIAPRPRELTGDKEYLAKYQLLYFASLAAPTEGLDTELNKILAHFRKAHRVTSRIQFFDFNKVTIGVVIYTAFAWLYLAWIPHCSSASLFLHDCLRLTVPITWPNGEGYSLNIEVISYSLQIAATLMYGLAFYELTYRAEPNAVARRQLLSRTVTAQLIVGVLVGLAFHLITVWRAKSGDAPDPTRSYEYLDPGLLGQALAPSVIAPILLCLWARSSDTRVPRPLVVIGVAMLGGLLLGFIQFTYEINHPPRNPGEYYVHEFFLAFCIVLICLIIHLLGNMIGAMPNDRLQIRQRLQRGIGWQ